MGWFFIIKLRTQACLTDFFLEEIVLAVTKDDRIVESVKEFAARHPGLEFSGRDVFEEHPEWMEDVSEFVSCLCEILSDDNYGFRNDAVEQANAYGDGYAACMKDYGLVKTS